MMLQRRIRRDIRRTTGCAFASHRCRIAAGEPAAPLQVHTPTADHRATIFWIFSNSSIFMISPCAQPNGAEVTENCEIFKLPNCGATPAEWPAVQYAFVVINICAARSEARELSSVCWLGSPQTTLTSGWAFCLFSTPCSCPFF